MHNFLSEIIFSLNKRREDINTAKKTILGLKLLSFLSSSLTAGQLKFFIFCGLTLVDDMLTQRRITFYLGKNKSKIFVSRLQTSPLLLYTCKESKAFSHLRNLQKSVKNIIVPTDVNGFLFYSYRHCKFVQSL